MATHDDGDIQDELTDKEADGVVQELLKAAGVGDSLPPRRIVIENLLEAGEDGGGFLGYYAKGSYAPEEFADACNKESGHHHDSDWKKVRPHQVRHEFWRTVPMAGQPGMFQFIKSPTGGNGAYIVTVADIVWQRTEKDFADYQANYKEGKERGQQEAIRYGYTWLRDTYGVRDAEAFLQSWNKGADERAAQK